MRKIIYFFIIAMSIVFASCRMMYGDDRYYVRYECDGGAKAITVTTEIGELTFLQSSMSETFGPVSYGFNAYICATRSNYSKETNVRIYVCREGEPFVLKASDICIGSLEKAETSYIIDF